MTSTLRYGSSNLPQPRAYNNNRNIPSIRTRDVRSEEDSDKHNQGGHDDRRNPEEDPGGRVMSQQRHLGDQPQINLSGTRPDFGSAARGSYTDPALPYTGYPGMPSINTRSPVYQSPNPVLLNRPSGRHDQDDDPSQPYGRPQYSQERSRLGISADRHDQASRHEPNPSSRPSDSRTGSSTKQSALRSKRGPKDRARRTDTDDDEVDDDDSNEEDERVLFFIPSEGLNKDVLDFYLKQYLGRDSDAERGVHPRDRFVDGFFIRSKLSLSSIMVTDLKDDSRNWKDEKKYSRRSQLSYSKSDTAMQRLEMGPSERPTIPKKT